MNMLEKHEWPILMVNDEVCADTAEGAVLRAIIDELRENLGCSVLTALTPSDGLELFSSHAEIGCVVIEWEVKRKKEGGLPPEEFIKEVRNRNEDIPIFILTEKVGVNDLSVELLENIDGYIWKTEDTPSFIAGRIEMALVEYVDSVLPVFFKSLVKYAEEYKYAWHTPGHMGGVAFLKTPSGKACHDFFGENVFRSDLSVSVPELGSLLDHEGPVGDAENEAAKIFGSKFTFFVLNGTSTANQIVWHGRVTRGDIALVDRNCHKSLNYAICVTGAIPIYLRPSRNAYGTIGPIHLSEFDAESVRDKIEKCPLIPADRKNDRVTMSAVTNSTYDGLCYNVNHIKDRLSETCDNLHFDEAWYAYAKFHPIYRQHFGMCDSHERPDHPPVFTTQSTHKLLAAWSQGSMVHVKDGGKDIVNKDLMNESYMMHASTSPQYGMIATLDVAARMMKGAGGRRLMQETLEEPVIFRKKMAKLSKEIKELEADDTRNWWFTAWQPEKVSGKDEDGNVQEHYFEDVSTEDLLKDQSHWYLDPKKDWHLFKNLDENSILLDPLKVTIATPGITREGQMADWGIPASIVTSYLMTKGVVVEKTGHYSWLVLFSIGITKGKSGTMLAEMFSFKKLYDDNALVEDVLPQLVADHPERYKGMRIQELCREMHDYIKKNDLVENMLHAFEVMPEQAMIPADAFERLVHGKVESVQVDEGMMNRVAAVQLVPYPPGIPIMMPGERFTKETKHIIDYLMQVQEFEMEFPGFEGDIHGIEREKTENGTVFKTFCIVEE